jgi:hypothetical protein
LDTQIDDNAAYRDDQRGDEKYLALQLADERLNLGLGA